MRRTLWCLLIIGMAVVTTTGQGRATLGCWDPINKKMVSCGGSSSGSRNRDESYAAAIRAAETRAKAAADAAEAAAAQGDYPRAIRGYQTALDSLPAGSNNKLRYERRLLQFISLRRSKALNDLLRAAAEQKADADGESDTTPTTSGVYDGGRARSRGLAEMPPVPATGDGAMEALARKLQIRVDLNAPKNAAVKDALLRVVSIARYNYEGTKRGVWQPDYATLRREVDDLKGALSSSGASANNVTPESVTEAFNSYQVGLGRGK